VQAVESQREKLLRKKLGTSELDDYIIDSEVVPEP
jgi:hypothetical protein